MNRLLIFILLGIFIVVLTYTVKGDPQRQGVIRRPVRIRRRRQGVMRRPVRIRRRRQGVMRRPGRIRRRRLKPRPPPHPRPPPPPPPTTPPPQATQPPPPKRTSLLPPPPSPPPQTMPTTPPPPTTQPRPTTRAPPPPPPPPPPPTTTPTQTTQPPLPTTAPLPPSQPPPPPPPPPTSPPPSPPQTTPSPQTTQPPPPTTPSQPEPKLNRSCVSGEMKVEEKTKGIVLISQLSEGDVIFGITGAQRRPAWCKVEAVFPAAGGKNIITYDGFTEDHMVIDHSVHPYGKKGAVHIGPVYTLTTDCDASVNAEGQAFSPISTAFCPHELSWSEYITLMSAIRRVATLTGYFWFDTSVYHDNETAMVPHWIDQLNQICHELLMCSRRGQCQGFENVMTEFVHEHLNKKYVEVIEHVFPNIGGDVNKVQAGTMTEVVRPQKSSHIMLFSVIGSAMVVLLMIIVAFLVYRLKMSKRAK